MKRILLSPIVIAVLLITTTASAQIYKNGNVGTGATSSNGTAAPAGTEWSEAQYEIRGPGDTVVNSNSGFSAAYNAAKTLFFRIADDFTVPAGEQWGINNIRVYAYQTGSAATPAPFDGLRLVIYDTGFNVVWGDTTTNRLTSTVDSLRYRIFNTSASPTNGAPTPSGTTRKIWGLNAAVTGLNLLPGTYILEWSVKATNNAGNFCPPANVVGKRSLPGWNAIQYLGGTSYAQIIDSLAGGDNPAVQMDFPFEVSYSVTAIPIKLASFTGERKESANMLIWTTETENNNKGFELQRSADGRNFSTVAFADTKAPRGNSSSTLNYSYNDVKPLSGSNYYRLRQVDYDGRSSLSNVVLIKGDKVNALTLSNVYPNPAKSTVNVVLDAATGGEVTLTVTDASGKIVSQLSASAIAGSNNYTLNVGRLAKGSYVIKAAGTNIAEAASVKFVKD